MSEVADAVVRRLRAGPPTLGTGRLLCVDGPSGSGKTTLARHVVRRWRDTGQETVRVLHMDDLYPGWDGLEEGVEMLAGHVLAPLSRGATGRYRRWSWVRGRPAGWVEVAPVDLLVVEGCGAGAACPARTGVLVWLDAPAPLRLARGLARDGDGARERLERWHRAEAAHFARDRTRERADLRLETSDVPEAQASTGGRTRP